MYTNCTTRQLGTALLALIFTLLTSMSFARDAGHLRYASGQADINDPTRVDIALVLAADVSSSISSSERLFQREAYAQALRDPRVAAMALGGGAGRVAIAYMEWSGKRYQRVHLPIRVMSTHAEMVQFADDIMAIPDRANDPMYLQPTAVGDALLAAETAMSALPVTARDYIIDISGDGVINDGSAILQARERLLGMGLTVNGLPIEVSAGAPSFEESPQQRVTRFYADCVIGGPGAFHLVARGFGDVRETLIMKLMLEMAQLTPTEKSRIATAWNAGDLGPVARVIPAVVLQLQPQQQERKRSVDCGDRQSNAQNPFRSNN
ncbi:DUF1194 domain-containing protein [uncultured Roseobacter sp.]|uniref:DUF1194 domain-containing protein n=1 Tax=uncultured Roseobacter sp. TaxID=114847 RepID=UPI00260DDB63|nr:DUF1194 domain-containing protein [uncultured Roseobacter sp.]